MLDDLIAALYAAASFFYLQHVNHRVGIELTTR